MCGDAFDSGTPDSSKARSFLPNTQKPIEALSNRTIMSDSRKRKRSKSKPLEAILEPYSIDQIKTYLKKRKMEEKKDQPTGIHKYGDNDLIYLSTLTPAVRHLRIKKLWGHGLTYKGHDLHDAIFTDSELGEQIGYKDPIYLSYSPSVDKFGIGVKCGGDYNVLRLMPLTIRDSGYVDSCGCPINQKMTHFRTLRVYHQDLRTAENIILGNYYKNLPGVFWITHGTFRADLDSEEDL